MAESFGPFPIIFHSYNFSGSKEDKLLAKNYSDTYSDLENKLFELKFKFWRNAPKFAIII